MSNDKFRANIAKRVEKAKGRTELFYKRLSIEVYSRMTMKSPVDTGRFRANWNAGYGAINSDTSDKTDKDGSAAIAAAASAINSIHVDGNIIYLTNSLPYASRLEYDGWSRQAPAGMVRVTLSEMGEIVRNVATEVRKS